MPDGNNEVPFYKRVGFYLRAGIGLAAIGVVATAALAVSDWRAEAALERVSLTGTVIEDGIVNGNYSFAMQTEYGKKAFLVLELDAGDPKLSSIDALIQPGARFTVKGIVKQEVGKLELRIRTGQIKPE